MKIKLIATFVLGSLLLFSCKGNAPKLKEIRSDRTNVTVKITTNKGDITLRLYDETPKHRDNFLFLVDNEIYSGTVFHRVIRNFMIQGGNPNSRKDVSEKMDEYIIPAEINPQFFHKKGALAAARKPDQVNPEKESSGTQFYIVQGEPFTQETLEDIEQNKQESLDPNFKFSEEAKLIYNNIGGTPHLDGDYTIFGEVISGLDIVDAIANVITAMDIPIEDVVIKKIEIVDFKSNKK